MKKRKTEREPYYYPDYIAEALFRLGEASHSDSYPLLNKRIDIIHVLYNQFNNFPITEQVYSYVWRMLNNMTFYGYDKWVKDYWGYACQYYELSLQYSQEENEVQKTRFREFHLMVGVLMVYMKRYDLLQHIFTFTNSLPAKYPLVPSTFHYIFRCYKDLSKKNERMELLRYSMRGMDAGAREDSIIEGLLLDYIALLTIRLNTVNDYNITYSNPFDLPLVGDTMEKTARDANIARIITRRIEKWKENEDTLNRMGLSKEDTTKAISLLSQYENACHAKQEELAEQRDISEEKRAALKKDLIEAITEYSFGLPFVEEQENCDKLTLHIASQEVQLDDNLILAGRDSISNNLCEVLVSALYTEIRMNYCYQFLLNGTANSFAIPYRDMSKALDKLCIDDSFTILAMGVSVHFFDEVDGFSRDKDGVRFKGVKVKEIASNENSFIILKSTDVPSFSLRALTEKENAGNLVEIEGDHHLYSNIDSLDADSLILKVMLGYCLYVKSPLKYVRLRIAYQLDSDSVILNRVLPIKNFIV